MTVEHPAKVDAAVDPAGEANDFLIVAETLAYSENAREQNGSVDRGDFAIPTSLAGLRIKPVIEPAVLLVSTCVEEAKCVSCAFECFGF